VETGAQSDAARHIFYIGPSQDRGKLRAGLKHHWRPELGVLEVWDADKLGSITHELVRKLAESYAVIADARDVNANVYYEIGLAHAFNTPVIPLKDQEAGLPFDIHDQAAIEVNDRQDDVEYVLGMIEERLGDLAGSPSRTAVTAYVQSVELEQLRAKSSSAGELPLDGWHYLARRDTFAPLTEENISRNAYVYHLTYGVGEVREHSLGPQGAYEARVAFSDTARTLVLPDDSAFLVPR
jgi:hypothetical protein